ncbi:hypothetical protein HYPSUDRAFT_604443 [Hypholoma sublateritium FD-334 SS-4]|uniref:Secreted protein n=1 Tax=Hypholoma sublateritium (strain FD-334 SS-4) TaxID=945553 RepID=A0A0D2L7N6_HYPSF|nr:hypothetical protein HYPSUDRAFT_604443 [Hypholoma sublateritium FD-334 SS-4]
MGSRWQLAMLQLLSILVASRSRRPSVQTTASSGKARGSPARRSDAVNDWQQRGVRTLVGLLRRHSTSPCLPSELDQDL